MQQADPRLLEVRNGLTFAECLIISASEPELVQQWERLTGNTLISSNPLNRMIDEATGYNLHVMGKFADFVYDCIFLKFSS